MRLELGDCREVLKTLADASVDSVVCDPPYELGFMGKAWDDTGIAYDANVWRQVLRVLKPGGHLLAFGGSRTYHRLACAVEDAGFEIRDQIMWVYGSGFPKSLDVSKAIDKSAGEVREVIGSDTKARSTSGNSALPTIGGETIYKTWDITAPATDAARRWSGWGTALKPAHEPIVVARKPLIGTVAENVLAFGTGAINVDGCRVGTDEALGRFNNAKPIEHRVNDSDPNAKNLGRMQQTAALIDNSGGLGRWPANLIHDGSAEVVARFPQTTTNSTGNGVAKKSGQGNAFGEYSGNYAGHTYGSDTGSAARFFYTAKADATDRDQGLEGFNPRFAPTMGNGIGGKEHDPETATPKGNHHPTVKPTELMRYLCRLVTPPGGIVLDPFMGSGSTGKAAALERFDFIGIEQDPDYLEIARARIAWLGTEVSSPQPAPRYTEPARGVQLELRMSA